MQGHVITLLDYKRRAFDRFHVRRDPAHGTGWFVFGRNPEYGDTLIARCARPDKPPRRVRGFNGLALIGYRTKLEAQFIADRLNAGER